MRPAVRRTLLELLASFKSWSFGVMIGVLVMVVATTIWFKSDVSNNHVTIRNGEMFASDTSRLHSTQIAGVWYPLTVQDVQHLVQLGKYPISVVGKSHSMGGHTLSYNGWQMNMKHLNRLLSIDTERMWVRVEAGMEWSNLIRIANLYGLSPMTLQSYSSFTIGGSISVNAHGITNDFTVATSIISLDLVLADGRLTTCRLEDRICQLVIGGYGLFGIIVSATLKLVPNEPYELISTFHSVSDFEQEYRATLNDPNVGVKITRLNLQGNISHDQDAIHLMRFRKRNNRTAYLNKTISRLTDDAAEMGWASRMAYKWLFPETWMQRLRYWLERRFEKPLDWSSATAERNQLLHESATPLAILDSSLIELHHTHILQEYFVPVQHFQQWMSEFNIILSSWQKNTTNKIATLLNLTLRFVKQDSIAFLPYAVNDVYAFVLYFRVLETDTSDLQMIHRALVDLTLSLGGTFYLPYLPYYDLADLQKAYPKMNDWCIHRQQFDPERRLDNVWAQLVCGELSNPRQLVKTSNYWLPKCEMTSHPSSGAGIVSFREMVQGGCLALRELELFYRQVFVLVPEDDGVAVHERAKWFLTDGHKLTDEQLYSELRLYAEGRLKPKIYRHYREYLALKRQKDEIVSEVSRIIQLTMKSWPVENVLSVGDGGRYSSMLFDQNLINGSSTIVNDHSISFIERQAGSNWQFRFNEELFLVDWKNVITVQESMSKIAKGSIGVVMTIVGLHHYGADVLHILLQHIHRVLKPGGLFILREHDAQPKLIPLLHLAHFSFNAFTGVPYEEEVLDQTMPSGLFSHSTVYVYKQNECCTLSLMACGNDICGCLGDNTSICGECCWLSCFPCRVPYYTLGALCGCIVDGYDYLCCCWGDPSYDLCRTKWCGYTYTHQFLARHVLGGLPAEPLWKVGGQEGCIGQPWNATYITRQGIPLICHDVTYSICCTQSTRGGSLVNHCTCFKPDHSLNTMNRF